MSKVRPDLNLLVSISSNRQWIPSLPCHKQLMNDLKILPIMKQLNNLRNNNNSDWRLSLLYIISGPSEPKRKRGRIPDEAKPWVFESIQTVWRKYKNQLKKRHFEAYENDNLRMENRKKKEKETSNVVPSKDIFVATRIRKSGRVYKGLVLWNSSGVDQEMEDEGTLLKMNFVLL
ncbi:PREDICTED: uncharacterized protein LOC109243917 [Nicotiana attenuata]|uniref:uncharacterized protein LOC109243917 n=1 Tax=Nicotiana attenuata TaxID=49451 RepID=UPI0009057055|nr:PREDICTED: uncharacterized protein LOC109243917 [Nicotiana attenuata]